jgi:cell wall-associated NlpC family hydrolase
MSSATLRARKGVTAAFLTAGLTVVMTSALTSPANAATPPTPGASTLVHARAAVQSHHHSHATRRARHAAREARVMHHHDRLVHRVIHEARRQKGKPYVYGADGPRSFDCSGLVRYVYLHSVHRSLPHNAAQQYHSLHHIKRRHLRRGDLIFTDNGYISHVGIFAGHHHWWVAPHTGTHVQKQRIYSAHFVYARVLVIHHHH